MVPELPPPEAAVHPVRRVIRMVGDMMFLSHPLRDEIYILIGIAIGWLVAADMLFAVTDIQNGLLLFIAKDVVVMVITALFLNQIMRRYEQQTAQSALDQTRALLATREQEFQNLVDTVERQRRSLALLDKVRMALAHEVDTDSLIQTVVTELRDTLGYELVSCYLRDGNSDMVRLYHQHGYSPDRIYYPLIPLDQGVVGRVMRTRQAVFMPDVTHDPDFLTTVGGERSEICVPLMNVGESIGVINVETRGDTVLTHSDLDLLIAVAEHVVIGIRRAEIIEAEQRSGAQLQAIFENAPIGLALTTTYGQMLNVNGAMVDLLGYSADEFKAMNFADFSDPQDMEIDRSLSQSLLAGEIDSFKMRKCYFHKDGRIVHTILQVSLTHDVEDGKPIMIGQVVDVSELIRAEQTLQQINTGLETRIAERTADLQAANIQLVELDRLKSKFIADISHELRTPITSMFARLYLIEKGAVEKIPDHLGVMKLQLYRLRTLIEDVLHFSQEEGTPQDGLKLELLDMNALMREIQETYSARAQLAGLQLSINFLDTLPMITGDREYVLRAISNLLDNALKYTEQGQITVRTKPHSSGQYVTVEVQDTGRGIPPDDIPHLFERFYRGREVGSSTIPGTGLGLAIVKDVMDRHNGTIEVESTPGSGTIFRLHFPVAPIQMISTDERLPTNAPTNESDIPAD